MNETRARQISESSEMALVTLHGKAVYIQHVDEGGDTARVYALDEPDAELTVSLDSLSEHSDFQAMETGPLACPNPSE